VGVETAIIAGVSLLSAATSVISGQQQKKMADYQAAQAEADAEAAAAAAKVEAEKIRKAGTKQAAQANAAFAASGVETGSGSALRITSDIIGDAEEDAYTTLVNGGNSAARLNAQAQADRISGRNAATASYVNASGSLLQAGSTAYNGWKSRSSSAASTTTSASRSGASSNNLFTNMGVR